MLFDGDRNRKLRDEGARKGPMVNSTLLEFAMAALVRLRDGGHQDALRYIYEAAKSGRPVSVIPAALALSDAGIQSVGDGFMDMRGHNGLVDDDNRQLRTEAYPVILAALQPQGKGFTLRNPLDMKHTGTLILEQVTRDARLRGFNPGGTWRDAVDQVSGPGY